MSIVFFATETFVGSFSSFEDLQHNLIKQDKYHRYTSLRQEVDRLLEQKLCFHLVLICLTQASPLKIIFLQAFLANNPRQWVGISQPLNWNKCCHFSLFWLLLLLLLLLCFPLKWKTFSIWPQADSAAHIGHANLESIYLPSLECFETFDLVWQKLLNIFPLFRPLTTISPLWRGGGGV